MAMIAICDNCKRRCIHIDPIGNSKRYGSSTILLCPLSGTAKWRAATSNDFAEMLLARSETDTKAMVIEDYKNGIGMKTLKTKYRVGEDTIKGWLAEEKVPIHPKGGPRIRPINMDAMEYYMNGGSGNETRRIFRCTRTELEVWAKELGIELRGKSANWKPYDIEFKKKVLDKYLDGCSIPDLAKEFNCSVQVIHKWIEAAGIEKRDDRRSVLKDVYNSKNTDSNEYL